ncbi:MAG: restriction endonuclease subunit S [Clostridia bacterium]|nr:restriction endonuclease subunit S [Clostridia bacterium]
MKFKDIADIKSGLVLSRKRADIKDKIVRYKQLTLKSIDVLGSIDFNLCEDFFSKEKLSKDYLTHKNDIIIKLTEPFTAVLICEDNENLVVSSNFAIIRNIKNIDRNYLKYYLNYGNGKKEIYNNLQGSIIKSIKTTNLQAIAIDIPILKNQKRIIEILDLQEEKLRLCKKLENAEKQKFNYFINKLIAKGEKK